MSYTIGLDYGTNSCRCVIVNAANGEEVGTAIYEYETGEHGIILDKRDHNVARQNPADYIKGIEVTIKKAMSAAGIGVLAIANSASSKGSEIRPGALGFI